MKAKSFDRKFDEGKDVTENLDLSKTRRPLQQQRRVNVDFPAWMIQGLDREARRVGVTRQSIIKIWLAERLERSATNMSSNADAGDAGAG
ncbi:MAG: type II toxin-antitoxin system BrnA family antitoxin [Lysobacterales bacterium]